MKLAVFWVVAPTRLHGATTQKTASFLNKLLKELMVPTFPQIFKIKVRLSRTIN
jgi:hypothetical protein